LDINKLDLPTEHVYRTKFQKTVLRLPEESKVISSSIEITDSTFDSKVDFKNTILKENVLFCGVTFSRCFETKA
jgi:hypothetical protein